MLQRKCIGKRKDAGLGGKTKNLLAVVICLT